MQLTELNKIVRIRILQQFFGSIAGNLTKPFFGIAIAIAIGSARAGFILSIIGFFSIFWNLIGGKSADLFGRTFILLTSEIVRLCATLALIYAFYNSPQHWSLACIAFAIHTFASAFSRPASEAFLLDITKQNERLGVFQLNYVLWNISVLAGYIVGGLTFETSAVILFSISAAVSVTDIFLISFFLQESKPQSRTSEDDSRLKALSSIFNRDFLHVLFPVKLLCRNKVFANYLSLSLLQMATAMGLQTVLAVILVEKFAESKWTTSYLPAMSGLGIFGFLAAINAAVVIAALPIVRSSKFLKLSERTMGISGLAIYCIGYVGILNLNSIGLMIVSMIVLSIGESIFTPARQFIFARLTPSEQRGEYAALNTVLFRVGSSISPLMLSVYGFGGIPLVTIVGIGALTIAAVLLFEKLPLSSSEPQTLEANS